MGSTRALIQISCWVHFDQRNRVHSGERRGGTYVNHLIALFFLDDHGKIVRYDEYFDPRAFGSVAPTSR